MLASSSVFLKVTIFPSYPWTLREVNESIQVFRSYPRDSCTTEEGTTPPSEPPTDPSHSPHHVRKNKTRGRGEAATSPFTETHLGERQDRHLVDPWDPPWGALLAPTKDSGPEATPLKTRKYGAKLLKGEHCGR